MHGLVAGKYFNNKDQVVEGLMSLIKLMGLEGNGEFANTFVGTTCFQQIEKNLVGGKMDYKNIMLKSVL